MSLWAVVVVQLVERLLPTPEVHGSNPVIGKFLYWTFNCLPTVICVEKTKIKKKRGRNGPRMRVPVGADHFHIIYVAICAPSLHL